MSLVLTARLFDQIGWNRKRSWRLYSTKGIASNTYLVNSDTVHQHLHSCAFWLPLQLFALTIEVANTEINLRCHEDNNGEQMTDEFNHNIPKVVKVRVHQLLWQDRHKKMFQSWGIIPRGTRYHFNSIVAVIDVSTVSMSCLLMTTIKAFPNIYFRN